MNHTHHRHPRTLNEAFGPYADQTPLIPMNDPMPRSDTITLIGSIIAALILLILLFIGVIS